MYLKEIRGYILFLTERVTAVCGKETELGTVIPRTAIDAEILFAAHVMQTRFLERLSNLYILVQV